MDIKTVLTAAAVIVSLGSVAVTLWNYQRTAIAARKPVLIFEYSREGWQLCNVGNGPALNVIVARKKPRRGLVRSGTSTRFRTRRHDASALVRARQ